MTEDAATMIKIVIVLISLYSLLATYAYSTGDEQERSDFADSLGFGLGCILLPISLVILGFGIWLMTQGLILIGFGFLCLSGIINWGLPEFIKWLGGSE